MDWPALGTCVDPALYILSRVYDELHKNPNWKNRLPTMLLDLRFFKMFVWGLEYYWDAEAEDVLHLHSVIRAMTSELIETFMEHGEQTKKCWQMCSRFVERIEELKPIIRGSCIAFLGGAVKCKSSEYEEFYEYARENVDFLLFVLDNLKILSLAVDPNGLLKQKIGFLQEKLKLLGSFADVALELMVGGKRLDAFLFYTQTWATHVSCIACLHWMVGVDESVAGTMGHLLSDLMQKTMLIGLHLNLLKAARYLQLPMHQLAQFGERYVDFLLDNLDDVEVLREGLIFLLSIVTDPPKEVSGLIGTQFDAIIDPPVVDSWLIWTQIDAIISEVPPIICSVHLDETSEGTSISKSKLSDFLEKIDSVKAEVRKLHVQISSQSNFPKTNVIGFLDFLLRNLKHMLEMKVNLIPSLKFQIERVREELESLRPFLHHVIELRNEHEEIKDLWMRIINVVYNANYAIKLSSLVDVSGWYATICLSSVIEDIKLIKIEVKKIEDDHIYNNIKLVAVVQSSDPLPPQASTSRFEGAFIGFEDDARSIMDHLVGGQKDLKIICISGMPGQGKTTLARKIYNDPSIQYHFHRTAWCYVSKERKTRDLLIGILRDVGELDVGKNPNQDIQDLVEHLWRSLKGRRYMIVMDDIWDVEVWHEVQGSFPDDSNGSRILFTSRNHNLASQAKPNSISHPLRLFSEEESWELMKEKLFHFDAFPPEILEIAKQIAIYCKGLPLAISLIASVLGRTSQQMDLWNQVAENLKSHLVTEGCMHIIELSYRYLPEYLKSCFLYFAAFPRGKYIRARKLKLLWIAEGFVQENEVQRSEDLANEYMEDLVFQSLIVVRRRSSKGGIKTCTIHDLLYDFCLEKALEENFLQFTEEFINQHSSIAQKYDHYRLCFWESNPVTYLGTKLLISQVHSLRYFDHSSFFRLEVPLLATFKVITVLDLEYVPLYDCFYIPEALLSFVHLRYLAIYACIKEIPPSIAGLWNLQTLIIKGAKMAVKLPEAMFSIKSLRHVNIDGSCAIFNDSEPEGASTICNMESLASPIIYCNSKSEKLVKRLAKLRKLRCCFGEQFHQRNAIWLSIFRPLTKLETLRIDYQGYKAWFTGSNSDKFAGFYFPENLKKLTLSGLKLPWSVMSTIGKLSNLEVLKLEREACRGSKWDLGDVEFPRLRYLKLCELDVEQIDVSGCDDHPFPSLEELVVDGCERLEDIPPSFGDICTLKTITVSGWLSLEAKHSALKILGEQRDVGNDGLQVFIIFCGGGGGDDDDGIDPLKAAAKKFQRHMDFANILTSSSARRSSALSMLRDWQTSQVE